MWRPEIRVRTARTLPAECGHFSKVPFALPFSVTTANARTRRVQKLPTHPLASPHVPRTLPSASDYPAQLSSPSFPYPIAKPQPFVSIPVLPGPTALPPIPFPIGSRCSARLPVSNPPEPPAATRSASTQTYITAARSASTPALATSDARRFQPALADNSSPRNFSRAPPT